MNDKRKKLEKELKAKKNNNLDTERFEIIIGINPGYFHNNETNKNIEQIYSSIAKKVYEETDIYISAVITKSKMIYNTEWGCPSDGEVVYTISGTRNPEFTKSKYLYKMAVYMIAEELTKILKQSTCTVTFQCVKLAYITR